MRTSLRPCTGSRMLSGGEETLAAWESVAAITCPHTHTHSTSDIIDYFIYSTAELRPTMRARDAQTQINRLKEKRNLSPVLKGIPRKGCPCQ